MKSLQELYDEIMASDELKKQFVSLKPEQVEDFVKSQGCDATLEDIKSFLEAKQNEDKELSLDELENVAGGCTQNSYNEAAGSIMVIGCLILLGESIFDDEKKLGGKYNDEGELIGGRICNYK